MATSLGISAFQSLKTQCETEEEYVASNGGKTFKQTMTSAICLSKIWEVR
jgi:hypothetical protein